MALVRAPSSPLRQAEVHWYEAHGIGKRDFKIKRYLDPHTKAIPCAEALATHQSMGALVRQWIAERLEIQTGQDVAS